MAALLIAVIYLIFVSLGLPDSLLGSGWPVMQRTFDVPSSYAGYVSMTISLMTVFSALFSPTFIRKFHTKYIVIFSIFLSVVGLMGFSMSTEYYMLFIFAVPYGLGAGAIDASINHYVANNYSGAIMNFLHCFYGLGALLSPNIMAIAIKHARWNEGYSRVAIIQICIMAVCIISLPLWKKQEAAKKDEKTESAGIWEAIRVPGVLFTLIAFWASCSGEATTYLWTSSYFSDTKPGIGDETAAACGSLVFLGLMTARFLSGLVSNKLGDRNLIRIGLGSEALGILFVLLSGSGYVLAAIGFVLIGFGIGPVYPAIMHMAPVNFGRKYSAPVIGLQMSFAYIGSTFTPMLFGQLQQAFGIWIMPYYLLIFTLLNLIFIEVTYRVLPKEAA